MNIFSLSEQFVNEYIKLRPLTGTMWGISTFDDSWGDLDTNSYIIEHGFLLKYKEKLSDHLWSRQNMNKWEDLAYVTLNDFINMGIKSIDLQEYLTDMNSIYSTFQIIIYTFESMKKQTKEDWNKIVNRLRTMDHAMFQYIERLKDGIKIGKTVSKRQVRAVIDQASKIKSNFGSDLINQNNESQFMNSDELQTLCDKTELYEIFIDFLENEYMPHAVDHDHVGKESYEWSVIKFIGNEIDIMDTYNWGYREINKLMDEINVLCKEINPNFTSHLDVIKKACEDPNFIIVNHQDFLNYIKKIQNEAIETLGDYFDIPDVLKVIEVKKIPIDTELAQYNPPAPDFSRNGYISYGFCNNRPIPLYDQLSTAYHEGFPGHHLQCGLQVFFKDSLSLLGRLINYAGYAEGWALYAERFMEEQKLYTHPYYTLGMLINSLMRAVRVVIDIGIHLQLNIPDDFFFNPGKKWSFDLAKDMFMNVVGMPEKLSVDEINRYCGYSGQAISYKVGERTMLNLRSEYQKACTNKGIEYNVKNFHNLVLQYGGVTLRFLESKVREHIVKMT